MTRQKPTTTERFATLKRIGGLLLVTAAIGFLYRNEGWEVARSRALLDGRRAITVAPDRIDPATEGKLIHIMGPLVVPGTLADEEFGVSAPGAVQLRREVEMYQWSETKSGAEPRWSKTEINSAHFRDPYTHRNPAMRWQARTQVAPRATIGAFRLDQSLLGQLGPAVPMAVAAARLPDGMTLADGRIYAGLEPQSPRIGDVRITYEVVNVDSASIIGQQSTASIGPFLSNDGEALLLISPGERTLPSMLQQAEIENRQAAASIRMVGSLILFGGLLLLMPPLRALLAARPRFAAFSSLAGWKIAGLATLVAAPCTIAVGWLVAHWTIA